MKFIVLGAGMMGRALAYDLARSPGVDRVTIADEIAERATSLACDLASPNVHPMTLNVANPDEVVRSLRGHDCAISAVPYRFNAELTKAALEAGLHFCDLGGNDQIVEEQRRMDATARQKGLLVVPNCGLAPGLGNILAAGGARMVGGEIESITIRVGGLPQHPVPPLNYQLVFSAEGLINEYSGKAKVLRDFQVNELDAMTELETLEFPPPYGTLEAFLTSGGTSLLTEMFAGKVRHLDYKTIRYPGHCERFRSLLELGFGSSEPISLGSNLMTARELFIELLKKKLPSTGLDAVLLRTEIKRDGRHTRKTLRFQLIDSYDENGNISSMMRATAFPTSVIAQMITGGRIQGTGVRTPEQCVELEPLLSELESRNIHITQEWL
jgi:lysine 6-dehydrogenase